MARPWSPASWREKPIQQVPDYDDQVALDYVRVHLGASLPLVSIDEIRRLRSALGRAALGEAFLLQGGDCAEAFADCTPDNIRRTFSTLVEMAAALTLGAGRPVVKVGRIAGQFAKPRSEPTEKRNAEELPAYRGDIVNDAAFTASARTPDPHRMLAAYRQSASTLNFLRLLATGMSSDLGHLSGLGPTTGPGARNTGREDFMGRMRDAFSLLSAYGFVDVNAHLRQMEFYSSHDALLLEYEQGLTRFDEHSGTWFAGSAHMLWVGERTRQLDGAHVEFLRGVENPIGVKCSASISEDELLRLIDVLDPHNEPGRLNLIVRMGADDIDRCLPALVRAVRRERRAVLWSSDPMHGNTVKLASGYKTRHFDRIAAEIIAFFDILHGEGLHPGGIHLEMTGTDVTECIGGPQAISEDRVGERYHTLCDPRLNGIQALELAFMVAEHLRRQRQAEQGSPLPAQAVA